MVGKIPLQSLMAQFPGRYALFGTSLGGIYGATLLAQDRRFEAAVLIAAGGDLPSILAYTKEGDPKAHEARPTHHFCQQEGFAAIDGDQSTRSFGASGESKTTLECMGHIPGIVTAQLLFHHRLKRFLKLAMK